MGDLNLLLDVTWHYFGGTKTKRVAQLFVSPVQTFITIILWPELKLLRLVVHSNYQHYAKMVLELSPGDDHLWIVDDGDTEGDDLAAIRRLIEVSDGPVALEPLKLSDHAVVKPVRQFVAIVLISLLADGELKL